MKLATLLGMMSAPDLHELAKELRSDEPCSSAPMLASRIESDVRSRRHVEHCIVARRPPVFSVLRGLLATEDHRSGRDLLKQRAMAECEQLARRVRAGDLVATERHALYRRVVSEAWRTDLHLDGSELSILGVLRRELRLTQADHFLVVEHPDVEPFWRTADPFETVLDQLRLSGIIYVMDDQVVLPSDLVPWVREALGILMDDDALRRLLENVPNSTLRRGLDAFDLKTSGSKSVLIDRIVANFLPPHRLLQLMHTQDLRDLASENGARKSGSKDEVVERVVAHFRDGLDQSKSDCPPVFDEITETKRLGRTDFDALFGSLKSLELAAVLIKEPKLPGSGSKAKRIAVLWNHHRSEASLLAHLGNERLRLILERLGLKVSGSKTKRIERIIGHFVSVGRLREATKGASIVLRQPSDAPPRLANGE